MQDRDRDYHERDPHFDGELESIINDPMGREGEAIGVRSDIDTKEFSKRKNPFQIEPKVDDEMKQFRRLMKGTDPNRKK